MGNRIISNTFQTSMAIFGMKREHVIKILDVLVLTSPMTAFGASMRASGVSM